MPQINNPKCDCAPNPNVYTTKYANPRFGAMLMVMLPYVIYVAKLGFYVYLLSYLAKLLS